MPLHIPAAEFYKMIKNQGYFRDERTDMVDTGIPSKGCSDSHHTFGELYEHRYILWIALCRMVAIYMPPLGLPVPLGLRVWRSMLHADGTMFEDSFILGIGEKAGEQMTYHLHLKDWDRCSFATTLLAAPPYDGHKPEDVLRRIERILL